LPRRARLPDALPWPSGSNLDALRPDAERVGITPEMVRVPLDEIPADSACPTFQRERFLRQRNGS